MPILRGLGSLAPSVLSPSLLSSNNCIPGFCPLFYETRGKRHDGLCWPSCVFLNALPNVRLNLNMPNNVYVNSLETHEIFRLLAAECNSWNFGLARIVLGSQTRELRFSILISPTGSANLRIVRYCRRSAYCSLGNSEKGYFAVQHNGNPGI